MTFMDSIRIEMVKGVSKVSKGHQKLATNITYLHSNITCGIVAFFFSVASLHLGGIFPALDYLTR